MMLYTFKDSPTIPFVLSCLVFEEIIDWKSLSHSFCRFNSIWCPFRTNLHPTAITQLSLDQKLKVGGHDLISLVGLFCQHYINHSAHYSSFKTLAFVDAKRIFFFPQKEILTHFAEVTRSFSFLKFLFLCIVDIWCVHLTGHFLWKMLFFQDTVLNIS